MCGVPLSKCADPAPNETARTAPAVGDDDDDDDDFVELTLCV